MIASALEDMAQIWIEEGRALPMPDANAASPEADLVELIPLTIEAGVGRL